MCQDRDSLCSELYICQHDIYGSEIRTIGGKYHCRIAAGTNLNHWGRSVADDVDVAAAPGTFAQRIGIGHLPLRQRAGLPRAERIMLETCPLNSIPQNKIYSSEVVLEVVMLRGN